MPTRYRFQFGKALPCIKSRRTSFILSPLVMVMMRRNIFEMANFNSGKPLKNVICSNVADTTSFFVSICHWLKFLIGLLHPC